MHKNVLKNILLIIGLILLDFTLRSFLEIIVPRGFFYGLICYWSTKLTYASRKKNIFKRFIPNAPTELFYLTWLSYELGLMISSLIDGPFVVLKLEYMSVLVLFIQYVALLFLFLIITLIIPFILIIDLKNNPRRRLHKWKSLKDFLSGVRSVGSLVLMPLLLSGLGESKSFNRPLKVYCLVIKRIYLLVIVVMVSSLILELIPMNKRVKIIGEKHTTLTLFSKYGVSTREIEVVDFRALESNGQSFGARVKKSDFENCQPIIEKAQELTISVNPIQRGLFFFRNKLKCP